MLNNSAQLLTWLFCSLCWLHRLLSNTTSCHLASIAASQNLKYHVSDPMTSSPQSWKASAWVHTEHRTCKRSTHLCLSALQCWCYVCICQQSACWQWRICCLCLASSIALMNLHWAPASDQTTMRMYCAENHGIVLHWQMNLDQNIKAACNCIPCRRVFFWNDCWFWLVCLLCPWWSRIELALN